MPGNQEKIVRHIKRQKKYSLKRQSKHQNQIKIWQECWNDQTWNFKNSD